MKPITKAALAALIVPLLTVSAQAQNDMARNNYKVKFNASAQLQTAVNDTTPVKVVTNDVIAGLLAALGGAAPAGTTPSQCDIIAHYENDEDLLDNVEYYLVRTRGPQGGHFKTRIDPFFFDTEGGDTVFKRTFSANNTTVKATFWDAGTLVGFGAGDVSLEGSGFTTGNVTIKDVGTLNARLNQANARFNGSVSGEVDDEDAVATLSITFGSALSNDVFDDLPVILIPL
jgi:hypothetical protein